MYAPLRWCCFSVFALQIVGGASGDADAVDRRSTDAMKTNDTSKDTTAIRDTATDTTPVTGDAFIPTFDDVPDCDPYEPSLECIQELFVPLESALACVPF